LGSGEEQIFLSPSAHLIISNFVEFVRNLVFLKIFEKPWATLCILKSGTNTRGKSPSLEEVSEKGGANRELSSHV
jgi:hypothetical protein